MFVMTAVFTTGPSRFGSRTSRSRSVGGSSPARVPAAITVGATTRTDARASYSNFGTCLDVFAPGDQVVSASFQSDTGTSTLSGTSMAAPLVAGIVARYLGVTPGATPAQNASTLISTATPNLVTNLVREQGIAANWVWWAFLLTGMTTTYPEALRPALEVIGAHPKAGIHYYVMRR